MNENKKRDNLLIIKNAIEKEYERRKLPLATLNTICECFHDLLKDDRTYTFESEVKKFFSKFAFLSICERQIDWVIKYNPFRE